MKVETHSVALQRNGKTFAYLSHRGRVAWGKGTAKHHAIDYNSNPQNKGTVAKVEEN